MSDVPFEDTSPSPEQQDPPEEYVSPFKPAGREGPCHSLRAHETMTGELRLTKYNEDGSLGKSMLIPDATVSVDLRPVIEREFDQYVADNLIAEAKVNEASLRAMGAKGDGHDVIFEIDQPDLGLFDRRSNPRLRVLLRNGPAPVAVDTAVSRDLVERWAAMVQVVGQAMAECANKISAAVAAMQGGFGPEVPAAYQQTCPDTKPCMYQCPVRVGCSRGVQGPPDPETLLREDGQPF